MLRTYITEVKAIDPSNPAGGLRIWSGPNIQAISWGMAEKYLQENKLGYCKIVGELVQIIPVSDKGDPLFSEAINYDYYLN